MQIRVVTVTDRRPRCCCTSEQAKG